jgi:hypothetical protein
MKQSHARVGAPTDIRFKVGLICRPRASVQHPAGVAAQYFACSSLSWAKVKTGPSLVNAEFVFPVPPFDVRLTRDVARLKIVWVKSVVHYMLRRATESQF